MDRVLLKQEDVDMLFNWRDTHKEQIWLMPSPLRDVEIQFAYNAFRIRGIREEDWLKLYVHDGPKSISKMEFYVDRVKKALIHKKGEIPLTRESVNSILSCYSILMAFMVFEKPEQVKSESVAEGTPHQVRGKNGNKDRATYILRRRTEAPKAPLGGHHASPKGIFSVRGHYRQYKSGKVVWIKEYKKGEGDKKGKTYKIGNTPQEEVVAG